MRVWEPSFIQLLYATAVGTPLSIGFQTAYSISEYNISTSTENRGFHAFCATVENAGTYMRGCLYVRMEYEYYFPKYIYLSMSITGQVSALHYQISLWFTFTHFPLQKLREHIYFPESCRDKTTANMYSKYSYWQFFTYSASYHKILFAEQISYNL